MLDDRKYLEPPQNEPQKVLRCYFCNDWIYEGDDYYCLEGLSCCEYCTNLHYKQSAEPIYYEAEKADLEHHEIRE